MSAQPAYQGPLRAERGGLAPLDLPPIRRMSPAEIPLTLSADVLRLPYPPATRLVLAEIVSLYAANEGLCDASDKHFADRLTISTDTASRAVQQLEADGLLTKHVLRQPTGFYRTLVPLPAAIAAKAETNPYPQNAGSPPQNAGRESSRKMRVAYPQNAATPTRKMPVPLPAKCGSNIPSNIPDNFHTLDDAACAAGAGEAEKKIGEVGELEIVTAPLPAQATAAHTEGGAADVATSITRRRLLMRESPLATLPAFVAIWQAAAQAKPDTYAPYACADLAHYHGALLGWSNAEGKTKFDWLATILGSMRRDAEAGRLRKASALPPGSNPSSPVLQRLAVAEAAFALNEYDAAGNRIN